MNSRCDVTNLHITTPNHKITSVNGKTATNQHEGFYVNSQTVHYVPTEIGSFFINIKSFTIGRSKLKEITKKDLKAFTNLVELILFSNDLEKLDGDLFEHNRKLQYLKLDGNKLKHVGEELLRNLNLIATFFDSNSCISAHSTTSNTTSTIIQKLLNQCPSTKDMKIRMYFEEDFKEIEAKLKSFEGILNTATKHFYEMTRQSGSQMQCGNFSDRSIHSKVLTVVVQVDGSKFTAVGWKVDAFSIQINSVNDAKGNLISLPATATKELIIEEQQTFFLPSNLGKQFPMLEVLAVTSSSLYAIDAGIFNKMTFLKTLNLTNNKLREIPIGSFSENKNLEYLDFSFNFLEHLNLGAFDDVKQLEVLILSSNNIRSLPSKLFGKLKNLQILKLSDNKLKSIAAGVLPSRSVIKEFHIKNNKLETIEQNILRSLRVATVIDFSRNACIDYKYEIENPETSLETLFYQVNTKCSED